MVLQLAQVSKYLDATYPGGKEIAAALVAEWRTLYARRRALMEELSRAGF